uniref:reduced folate transporter-like n=1 Tax=Oncorhynchus gorbuscha TaxID=8017 RepID=UPI001EAED7C3|nr:reduced folate transporter-like [Oncorhynchus gorbuscha]
MAFWPSCGSSGTGEFAEISLPSLRLSTNAVSSFYEFEGIITSVITGDQIMAGKTYYLRRTIRNHSNNQKATKIISQSAMVLAVTNEINPILSYSYMAVLVPVFLLTDVLRYKPVLVLSSLSHVAIWLLLLLGSSLLEMQFMEFFYGITMAARVAYSSYIFSLVTPELYQRVASYSRSCVLMGVFASSVLGQVLISVGRLSFATLSVVSLALVSFGLVLSVCLPWPKRSLFFNRAHHAAQRNLQEQAAAQSELARMKQGEAGLGSGDTPSLAPLSSGSSWRDSVFIQMLKELRNVPRRPSLRLWSQWWVFNSAGYYLVLLYVHVLWNKVYPATENKHVYNGGVEAVSTLLGLEPVFSKSMIPTKY